MVEVLKPLFEQSGKDNQPPVAKADLYSAIIIYGTRITVSLVVPDNSPNNVYKVPKGKVFFLFALKNTLFRSNSGGAECSVYVNNFDLGKISYLQLNPNPVGDRLIDSINYAVPLRFSEGEIIKADKDVTSGQQIVMIQGYEIDTETLSQYYR